MSVVPPLSPDHPAGVDAPEAPYVPSPSVLAEDRTSPLQEPASQPASSDNGHEHDGMSPQPSDTPAPGTNAPRMDAPTTQPQQAATIYTCPMHPQVVRNAPGRCPICGMTLVKKSEQRMGEHHE
jgi:hypothetical protein